MRGRDIEIGRGNVVLGGEKGRLIMEGPKIEGDKEDDREGGRRNRDEEKYVHRYGKAEDTQLRKDEVRNRKEAGQRRGGKKYGKWKENKGGKMKKTRQKPKYVYSDKKAGNMYKTR